MWYIYKMEYYSLQMEYYSLQEGMKLCHLQRCGWTYRLTGCLQTYRML